MLYEVITDADFERLVELRQDAAIACERARAELGSVLGGEASDDDLV